MQLLSIPRNQEKRSYRKLLQRDYKAAEIAWWIMNIIAFVSLFNMVMSHYDNIGNIKTITTKIIMIMSNGDNNTTAKKMNNKFMMIKKTIQK